MAAGTGQVAYNTSEGGTSGTTITTGNSGAASGNAWQATTIGTGSTLAYDKTHAAHGLLATKIINGAAAKSFVQWTTTFGTQTTFYGRAYIYFAVNPTNPVPVFQAATAGTQRCAVGVSSTGVIQLYGSGVALASSTAAITLNAWVRLEFTFTISSTVGSGTINLYNTTDSLTITETVSVSSQNFGGTSAAQWNFGVTSSPAAANTFWLDGMALSTDGYLGVDNSEMGLNNFQAVKVEDNGNGVMSVSERIR